MSVKLLKFNLSVCLEVKDPRLTRMVSDFLDKFYTSKQQGFGANQDTDDKMFASRVKNSGIFFLHNRQFAHLYHYLKDQGVTLVASEVEDYRDYIVKKTKYKVREGWKLREGQVPVSEFLLDDPSGSKLVPLATGSGKTATALITLGVLKKRFAIIILPFLMDKWVQDIVEIHDANTEDVLLVQGFKALATLIDMAKEGDVDCEYFLISNRTMQDFIKAYETDPDSCIEMYGCSPIELFPLLGIGVLLIDEVHMSFHSVFKTLIHTNVEFQIGLSATLISEDPLVTRIHNVVYKKENVYGDRMIQKYADVYPITYNIQEDKMRFIKTANYGSKNYSHIAYEQSIMKNHSLLQSYFKLIESVAEDYFNQFYMENDKLIIFVSTIKFATILTERMEQFFPKLLVSRYCEKDLYEDMIKADVIVTTVLSAGTGLDIPNLRVGIQTVCISSTVMNIQSLGRLRKLKDRDVKFCYLYTNNIPKQYQYHRKRMEIFADRVATITQRRSRVDLR